MRKLILLAAVVVASASAAAIDRNLEPVAVDLVQVADSGSYLVYIYEVVNPNLSSSAAATFSIDVGASSGAPSAFAATGAFVDLTALAMSTPIEPYARVGPLSPAPWRAVLQRDGVLAWLSPAQGSVSTDSIPAGDTLSGVGIRSDYLPALSTVVAEPTLQSCCSALDTLTGQFPDPRVFAVTSTTVAPRLMPSEVTLDLLQSQRTAVCTEPLWIDDAVLCDTLGHSLDMTESRLANNDNAGARVALEGVLSTLDAQREPAGPVEHNAYWLLRINTEHVLGTIPGGPITVAAPTDTYLRQGNPNQNQGSENVLSLRASGRHRALVRAELPSVSSSQVTSARLEFDIVLNAENWGTSGRTIDAHRMLVAWTEGGATWNCPNDTEPGDPNPDCTGAGWQMFTLNPSPYAQSASGSLLVTGSLTGTVSIDVTGDVQGMLAGQLPNHGWIVRKTDEGAEGRIEIASKETGAGPRLVIELGSE